MKTMNFKVDRKDNYLISLGLMILLLLSFANWAKAGSRRAYFLFRMPVKQVIITRTHNMRRGRYWVELKHIHRQAMYVYMQRSGQTSMGNINTSDLMISWKQWTARHHKPLVVVLQLGAHQAVPMVLTPVKQSANHGWLYIGKRVNKYDNHISRIVRKKYTGTYHRQAKTGIYNKVVIVSDKLPVHINAMRHTVTSGYGSYPVPHH